MNPTRIWILLLAGCPLFSAPSELVDSAIPAYRPQPVAIEAPRSAGYVLADGSLQIVAFDDMGGIVDRLDRLFAQVHPGFRFSVVKANNLASLYSLVYDATAFAPVGAEFLPGARGPYKIIAGAEPFGIRIAHGSVTPGAKVSPLAIIVNPANPLARLSEGQVARIFSAGGRGRDLTHWGQAGVDGQWAEREIHPCGLPESDHYRSEDSGFGDYLFVGKFGGGSCSRNYRRLPDYADVVKEVAADPLAIGVTALNRVTPAVKVVAVGGDAWTDSSRGTAEDIIAGRYAFDRYLCIYVRRAPGKPLEPFLREYLSLVLSRDGQEAIAGEARGYLPLNATEIGEERAKLGLEPAPGRAGPVSPATAEAHGGAASYVLADGSIYVAGNDLLSPFLARLNALFIRTHPGLRFTMDLHGSSLAISGITSGKSAFGPTARDATFQDLDAFASRYGYAPTDIQVGWDNTPDVDHFPPNGKFPPGIWVNARNPLPSLTVPEIVAIFTTGSKGGDLTHWGQIAGDEGVLGANGGDWSRREIHVYLPGLHGLPVISTTRQRFGGLPWTPRAEYLPGMEDVMNAVANDVFGIGFIGWWPEDEGWDRQVDLGSKVRFLPLAPNRDSKVSHGGSGDLYPLAGGIHFYVNRVPGRPLEPWLKDYLQLALSREGQDILASLTKTDGFIPLDPEGLAKELAKLE